jgi:hypothetical protein
MLWLGVFLLVTLAVFCLYADISPWLNIPEPLQGNGDDPGQ